MFRICARRQWITMTVFFIFLRRQKDIRFIQYPWRNRDLAHRARIHDWRPRAREDRPAERRSGATPSSEKSIAACFPIFRCIAPTRVAWAGSESLRLDVSTSVGAVRRIPRVMNDFGRRRCVELRLRLREIDGIVERLLSGSLDMSDDDRKRMEGGTDRRGGHIAASLENAVAARARIEAWIDHVDRSTEARSALVPSAAPKLELNERANDAEAYALSVLELAGAATRECAQAVLEAILARANAERPPRNSGLRTAPVSNSSND